MKEWKIGDLFRLDNSCLGFVHEQIYKVAEYIPLKGRISGESEEGCTCSVFEHSCIPVKKDLTDSNI